MIFLADEMSLKFFFFTNASDLNKLAVFSFQDVTFNDICFCNWIDSDLDRRIRLGLGP